MLYAFFWVITRRLEFICRRFGTLCLFHLHRRVDVSRQSVPKRRHINSRRRVITQKKAYNEPTAVRIKARLYIDEDTKILRKIQCRHSGFQADLKKNLFLDKPDALFIITDVTQLYDFF